MATTVDLAHGTATRPKVPRLKVRVPPKQEISRTHSEGTHHATTRLTIARIILIKQTDSQRPGRYHEPLGYDPGVFNARLKA